MHHDHPANHPRRNAPRCRVGELLLAFAVLIMDARGLGEPGAQIMRCTRLQGLAILHHRLDGIGGDGPRKAFILRLFARHHRHRQHVFGKFPVHFQRPQSLLQRVLAGGVGGVPLLPQELAGAQEHPRAHFPAHHIGPLVDAQRQITPALHPAAHGGADHRLAGGAHDQRFFQLGGGVGDQAALAIGDQAVVGNNRHFLGEPLHMVGFLGEVGQRDEQREVAIFHPRRLDAGVHQRLYPLPNAVSPRLDHHTAAHARFLGHVGGADHLLIPSGEVVRAAGGKGVFNL